MYWIVVLQLFSAFSLAMTSNTLHHQQSKNSSATLEHLKHVFDSPNCSDESIVCKTLTPKQVEQYLATEVYYSVEKLCLIIKPPAVWDERDINLAPLQNLTSLKWFWIQSQPLLQVKLIRLYEVRLQFPDVNNSTLPLVGLFINTPLYGEGTETIAPFIKGLDNLQILSLSNTRNINKDNVLPDIIQGTHGKPIQALSLKAFQRIANIRDKFLLKLNISELLWPLKESPLEYLDLSYNDILTIEPGITSISKNLRILDVSHNNLIAADNKGMLIEFILHPKLEVIYINNQGISTELEYARVKRTASSKDEYLHDSIITLMHQCMDKLNITLFDILEKSVFCELLYCIDYRYLHQIPCEALPSYQDIIKNIDSSCTYNLRMPIGQNLQELYADELHIAATGSRQLVSERFCFGQNNIKKVTFTHNRLLAKDLYLDEDMKYRSIDGLNALDHVDLSDNGLQIPLYNRVLQSLTSLKYLYLKGNYIILNNSDICHGNKLLEVLDLRNNDILEIPDRFVENCSGLKTLDLSENSLSDVYTLFSAENHLQVLNASNNRIRSLSNWTIANLKKLGSKNPVKIDLSNNPWDCGCDSKGILESVEFLKSAQRFNITFHHLNEYQCYQMGSYHFIYNTNVDNLRKMCFPSNLKLITVTVVVTVSIILFIILLLLCYKCRYRINTFYFHTCQKIHTSHTTDEDHSDIIYDAFISYAAEDRFWVHDVLMTQLEKNYGFHLCLHYRDFPACGDIADVIVNYIRKSRSIVVILSDNSVRRPWCEFELKSAHAQHLNQGKNLIIVKLGKIPKAQGLSDLVTDLLNSKVYIEWPETGITPTKSEKRKQELFWTKVERAIYGEDYCGCFRYCNPCYDKNDSLTLPLLDDSIETQ